MEIAEPIKTHAVLILAIRSGLRDPAYTEMLTTPTIIRRR